MNNQMDKNTRLWLVLATLLVVGVLALVLASSIVWFPPLSPFEPRRPPLIVDIRDLELYYTAGTIMSALNLTLLVFLLATYVSIYRKTKSQFTIGLIVFSIVFFLNILASSPVIQYTFGFRAIGLGPFALLPDIFTFAALIVLLYLSIKY
jgi:hypothetical protein